MVYGEIFNNLREKNLSNWLLYTQHEFLKKLSKGTLKKDYFLNYLKQDYLFLIQLFPKAFVASELENLDFKFF